MSGVELAEQCAAHSDPGPTGHRADERQEAVSTRIAVQLRECLLVERDSVPVRAEGHVREPEVVSNHDRESGVRVREGICSSERAAPGLATHLRVAAPELAKRPVSQDPREPQTVAETMGERLRDAEMLPDPLDLTDRPEREAELQPDVDGQLDRAPVLGQMLERRQRL